jgi:hypothetical protein
MTRWIGGTLCIALLATGAAAAQSGKGRDTGRTAAARTDRDPDHSRAAPSTSGATTSIHFSVEHVRVIRGYYAPRYRHLPKGLQKKYQRTGQLPPGWQKKMEPMPIALERDLPPLPAGYRRGVIDGHAVIYSSRSGTIVDVAVLF